MGVSSVNKQYEKMLCDLQLKMTEYFAGDTKRIFHFTKVYSLAGVIGGFEGLDEKTLFTLRAAALVHDIGIKVSEEKYGSCTGKQQEIEGPPIAEKMMKTLDFPEDETERVSFLVAHHHTYNEIDGIDYQILVESDLIVNMEEDRMDKQAIKECLSKIFKTKTGVMICRKMFKV